MKSITIDIWDKLRERISVPQREILGRTIRFTITDRSMPVNLTGSTVTIYAVKPDDNIVFNALTVITAASGIAEITLTEQMIVVAGTLQCTLLIVDGSSNETRTQPFEIEVVASPDFTTSVESTSEYTALSALSAEITAATTNIGDLLYTEDNYITDEEPLTESVDKLDMRAKDNADAIAADVANFLTGWIPAGETWTYASASTITVASGAASRYQRGDKIKWTQTTVKYGVIVDVADTLLTIAINTDYTVASAVISANYISRVESPFGFPEWFACAAPSMNVSLFDDGSAGQPTISECRYTIQGHTVKVHFRGWGYAAGTGATLIGFADTALPLINRPYYTGRSCVGSVFILAGAGNTNYAGVMIHETTSFYSKTSSDITNNDVITDASITMIYEI
jgi:hypothetical protein